MSSIFLIVAAIAALVFALVGPTLSISPFGSSRRESAALDPGAREAAERHARKWLIVGIGFLALSSILFRILVGAQLQQTSALFIGIPTLLAMAAVFLPTPKSAVGVAVKTVTIGLLTSLIFLGEGMVCVLMSAPLFYGVAIAFGLLVDHGRRRRANPNHNYFSSWIALLAFVPMSLEGVTPMTTLNRLEEVSETRIVNVPVDRVAAALTEAPRFDRTLPRYLAIGFPRPTSTRIDGERWVIRMRGGEMRLNGLEPRAGDLILERDGKGPDFMSWRVMSDDSHMTHYLNWMASRVEWQAIDANHSRVTWTLRYRRGLDPAWYFGPMERYAMQLAAGYLIDSVATP